MKRSEAKGVRALVRGGVLVLALGAGTACGESPTSTPEPAATQDAAAALENLDRRIAEVRAREEHDAEEVEVQHLLVSFAGLPRVSATRSQEEARALTAELLARIDAGEDFDDLVRTHTDDAHPGIYTMTTGTPDMPGGVFARSMMASAFGDVAWRLAVGEVGVTDFDSQASPFGFHIIRRQR